jgi:hypothetical protein
MAWERGSPWIAREGKARFPRFPSKHAVWLILHDPFYSGTPTQRHGHRPGRKWPGLWPQDQWIYAADPPRYRTPIRPTQHAALLELMARRRSNAVPRSPESWCSQIAVCPEGHRLCSSGRVYKCNSPDGLTHHLAIAKGRLESLVTDAVLKVMARREFVEAVLEEAALALSRQRADEADLHADLRRARSEAQRYEKLLRAVFEQHALGGLTDAQHERWRAEYRKGLSAAESEIERLRRALEAPVIDEAALRPMRELLADPHALWEGMAPADRRAVAQAIVERVEVIPCPGHRSRLRLVPRLRAPK